MKNNIVRNICIIIAALILAAAYSSRTIENLTLTKVTLCAPFKGTISPDSPSEGVNVRIRTPVKLIVEDVFITPGKRVAKGDRLLSVYDAAVDRSLSELPPGDEYDFLSKIKENGYILTAPEDGRIGEVNVKTDAVLSPDEIICKYVPADADISEESRVYETIVPLGALTPTDREGQYIALFAVPLTGKGEAGQYQVMQSEVRVLASDGKYAALDTVIRDGRQIITHSDRQVSHMQKVKAG